MEREDFVKKVTAVLVAFWMFCPLAWGQGPVEKPPTRKKPVPAAVATPSATPAAAQSHAELTAQDLTTFMDGFMPQQLEQADIAGAVVAVVKDGQVLFAKGYGYSDYEKKTPVSAGDTLFRPGSISKLFTWTAVMQLVEQGKLQLDRDVNDYLDFKLPETFGNPITLRDIMTHRSGLGETIKDLFVGTEQELRPLSVYLPSHVPNQIFAPGTIPAYSNYATTVAAYIVQRVSGQSFDDYVDQHILQPLNMKHATFRQPLPADLKALMSNGYNRASQGAKTFEYVQVAPAGSLSASGEAMTHFMIAHLQNGRYGETQILKPETAIEMHARQDGWPAAMPAQALGFYEETRNGHRIIGHGGDTQYFHSDLHLILDANTGFFVSYNSAGRDDVSPREVVFQKFLERYFPGPALTEPTLSTAAEDAKQAAGSYKVSRRFEGNILAMLTVLGEAKVEVDGKDNTIFIADAFKNANGEPKHFREIAPMLFRDVDGQDKLDFVKDANGNVVMYINFPFMVFQRIHNPLNKTTLNYIILGFSLGVIALTLLLWPVGAALRKHYGKPLTLDAPARKRRAVLLVVCFLNILFVICFAIFLSALEKLGSMTHADLWLHLIQIVGVLAGIGALYAAFNAALSLSDKQQWVWYRVWNVLLGLACLGAFWFAFHWSLLNFTTRY
ncbi:MAG TPA: serine hydrolase domain-containing protein [Candidatus Acidoferrum sp.]|jgi:CubicO group peptidase (beta-lactamase class C family)